MSKKVIISTFNNSLNNYGAIFQSYALSKTVEKMGHDPRFLTVQHRVVKNYVEPNKTLKRKIKEKISRFLSKSTQTERIERAKKFKAFINKNQNQIYYKTLENLAANPPIADIYISGSDQVWNPKSLHEELFLSFAPDNAVLASYAASMGTETVPERNKELFAKYIARYDAVSVREDTMINIIESYTNKPIKQHVDPVFLLKKEEWEKLAVPYTKLKYKKYILMYLIEFDRKCIREFKKLKKQTGLPIVLVTLNGIRRRFANQVVFDASPEEFLYLLSGAEMVVASSFHGSALSVIFNKPFITLSGKDKPTRIESMLRHFGLEKQNNAEITFENANVDFQKINCQIEKDYKESIEYLDWVFSIEK